MAYTPLKLNTGMAASPGFGDVYRNFSGQSGNNDSPADWTGRLANEAKRKSMGTGIFANNSAAWDAYNSGNVQGFQDALGTPQDTYDPMYRSTHTPQDAAADTAGMAQFDSWAANQKAQGLQTNGGMGGYSENWSAGFGGPKFSGVAGGPSTLPQEGIKKPMAASQPVQPPAAQNATPAGFSGAWTQEMAPQNTPAQLPPANVSNMPMSGGNTIASGPSLMTGMASQAPQTQLPQAQPIAQTAPVAAPANTPLPDTMSQDDPWAWQAWAAQREPEIYGWQDLGGAFDVNGGSAMSGSPAWWGNDIAGYATTDDPTATLSPEQSQMLADAGYKYQTARGPGYANLWQVLDPNGKQIDKGGFNKTQSLHGEDYAMFASVAMPAIAPYISAGYGSMGLAAGSAGNAAATGATIGGGLGHMSTGTFEGGVKGAVTGAATGYLGNQVFGGGGTAGDFQDPSMWQANDMATPNLTQLPGIDGMGVNVPEVSNAGQTPLDQPFQDPAQWQAADQFPTQGFQDPSIWQAGDQFSPNLSPMNPNTSDLALQPQAPLAQNTQLGQTTPATPSPTAPAASNPLASVADFLKQNPQLAAALISGGLGAGGGGNPPAPPTFSGVGSGTSTGTGTSGTSGTSATGANSQLASALKYSAGDPSQFYQDASDAAYRNQTRYLDPQVAQQQKALEARLAEQGFVPGTPGYNQAMQNFMDTNARAYAQARDTSTLQGYQVGSQNFGNSLSNAQLNNNTSNMALDQLIRSRMMPINERNAIMTGDQIQYNNQLDQYNAKQETRNSNNQLLGQLATALGMYYSDARLKDDIVPLGQTPGGLGIYSYTIFGRREIGVIAQEVAAKQPHACALDPDSGFLMVDYGRIA